LEFSTEKCFMAMQRENHSLSPVLTPQGHLILATAQDAPALAPDVARRLRASFSRGAGHGLLQLGAEEVATALPPVFSYWREFGARYVTAVCTQPDAGELDPNAQIGAPPPEDTEALAAAAPPMTGAEYLSAAVLGNLWRELERAFHSELGESGLSVQEFLKGRNPAWNLVGRVHFNLAENRRDEEAPFAFLATYTTRLSAHAKAQHLPLGQALREYAGAANRDRLLALLVPVQRAAGSCAWLKAMVDAGEVYHPLRWTPEDALRLLKDQPLLEAAGVVVRMPGVWSSGRPPRPQASATLGARPPSILGKDALLDFRCEVSLDGESLSPAEVEKLLAGADGLQLVRGRWIEVDREKLARALERFRRIEENAAASGLSLAAAMRMLSGADIAGDSTDGGVESDWSRVAAGPWLAEALKALRSPEGLARVALGQTLKTTLRPYQEIGVRWLYLVSRLGFGACLADDMGLGKTIQVLALLLVLKQAKDGGNAHRRASLLVAPASLLANWAAEIERFAPSLRALVAHPSAMPADELKALDRKRLAAVDLVITSYGTLLRAPQLVAMPWRLAVLDEAQAIKNPAARQTREAKKLDASARIALSGTPVENRLGDLWSIFDFINPGLLGSSRTFSEFARRLAKRPHNPYAPLRALVRPYILRRLKTDKSVIADLPDKTEVKAFCSLTRRQAALYQQAVQDMASQLQHAGGIARKGTILAFLMRFKQICNHPSQWLGDGAWEESGSGKFGRLRELGETIAAKQEKALVFTQFRETTAPLSAFLGSVFGRAGLVLHGETEVSKRKDLVRRFQEDETVPFFVLSLKAGGAGLNLTAASHVIHFDRWWNPAVENQATDRAFRIGQTKNVLVHKFVCRGTVEEKIDAMIESKQQLSKDLLEGGANQMLTELNDAELMKLVALDIHRASAEG
jgi:non-specific serine/threonine protein kinase